MYRLLLSGAGPVTAVVEGLRLERSRLLLLRLLKPIFRTIGSVYTGFSMVRVR